MRTRKRQAHGTEPPVETRTNERWGCARPPLLRLEKPGVLISRFLLCALARLHLFERQNSQAERQDTGEF